MICLNYKYLLNSTKLYKSNISKSTLLIIKIFRDLSRLPGFGNTAIYFTDILCCYVPKHLDIFSRNYRESCWKEFHEFPPKSSLQEKNWLRLCFCDNKLSHLDIEIFRNETREARKSYISKKLQKVLKYYKSMNYFFYFDKTSRNKTSRLRTKR